MSATHSRSGLATWAGVLYLAVVLDAWSQRIIGWAMESHLCSELVVAVLNMAVASADRVTSFITRIKAANTRPSPSARGPGPTVDGQCG